MTHSYIKYLYFNERQLDSDSVTSLHKIEDAVLGEGGRLLEPGFFGRWLLRLWLVSFSYFPLN